MGNYFADNYSVGLQYEISYNAVIEWNTFIGNGVAGGPSNPGFPTSAIYISESGSDTRVKTAYSTRLLIAANNFVNNWGGVILWENSNRFCSSGANTSTSDCTLVDPGVANLTTCAVASAIAVEPLFSDCRWKTQNVRVEHNTFTFNPMDIKGCEQNLHICGYNGVFSEYGTYAPYEGNIVPTNIAFFQNNHFESNKYIGPWQFMGWQQGSAMTWNQWRSCTGWQTAIEDTGAPASGIPSNCGQDQGSTMSS